MTVAEKKKERREREKGERMEREGREKGEREREGEERERDPPMTERLAAGDSIEAPVLGTVATQR